MYKKLAQIKPNTYCKPSCIENTAYHINRLKNNNFKRKKSAL